MVIKRPELQKNGNDFLKDDLKDSLYVLLRFIIPKKYQHKNVQISTSQQYNLLNSVRLLVEGVL